MQGCRFQSAYFGQQLLARQLAGLLEGTAFQAMAERGRRADGGDATAGQKADDLNAAIFDRRHEHELIAADGIFQGDAGVGAGQISGMVGALEKIEEAGGVHEAMLSVTRSRVSMPQNYG